MITAVFPATAATPATVISTAAIAGLTAPVRAATPVTTITSSAQYTGTVSWSGAPVTFAGATTYTATITLTPATGYTLSGVTANFFTVAGATTVTNAINSGVITAVFPATAALAPTITSLATTSGTRRGGTSVVITGTGFATGATASFGGVAATSVTVDSVTQLSVVTGIHAMGVVDVVVTNADTQSTTGTGAFTYSPAVCDGNTFACVVGDVGPGGGTVFYVAPTTFTSLSSLCSDSCSYLEYAPVTWAGGVVDPTIQWQDTANGVDFISNTTNVLGSGMFNTHLIDLYSTSTLPGMSFRVAAKVALTYGGIDNSSTGEWFLPSAADWNALFLSGQQNAGGFITSGGATDRYWTSNQAGAINQAVAMRLLDNYYYLNVSKGLSYFVRPFRAFGASKLAAPLAGTVSIIQPALDASPNQTDVYLSSSMEYKVLSADGAVVKQSWTGVSGSLSTSASPGLVAGDLIVVRYAATGADLASSDYIYTIQNSDIGVGTPIALVVAPTSNSLGTTVYLHFAQAVNGDLTKLPLLTDFGLKINSGVAINPISILPGGEWLDLVFGTSFTSTDLLTISYAHTAGNEIKAANGVFAAEFTDLAVTNTVPHVAIATSSAATIALGSTTAVINIAGAFDTPNISSSAALSDFVINTGLTGMVADSIIYDFLNREVSITFTSTLGAIGGIITIQAKPSAYSLAPIISSNILAFTVTAP